MQVMPFLIFSAVMYVIHVQRLTVCRFVQLTGTVTHCQWVAADNFAAQLSSVFIPATTCTCTKHLDRALGCDTSKACPCTLYAVIASLQQFQVLEWTHNSKSSFIEILYNVFNMTKLFVLSLVVELLTIVWMLSTLSLRDQRNHCPCPTLRQYGMVTSLASCLIQVDGHHPQLITLPAQLIASLDQTHGPQTLETSLDVAVSTPGGMKMLV